ncbi:hypothetical protein PUN28_018030 [Cardiocondyla obscurior]|uniref:Uncharacterized protein n=1 Tax=Cardiocondyla obscurior TaxID=286306 RepID=A0AAW2EI76_9HYME
MPPEAFLVGFTTNIIRRRIESNFVAITLPAIALPIENRELYYVNGRYARDVSIRKVTRNVTHELPDDNCSKIARKYAVDMPRRRRNCTVFPHKVEYMRPKCIV